MSTNSRYVGIKFFMRPETWERIKRAAEERDRSASSLARDFLAAGLAQLEREEREQQRSAA